MKKSTVIGQFKGKCCDATVFNNNDMKLPRELFENLFASEEYKRAIANRYYIGFLGHPEDPGCMDYRNACIVMTECHIEPSGDVVGTFDLVDTPVGRVVKSFIDAGVTFGISIRGAGDVDGEGNVDPSSFVFRGFDLVTFPAYDDCVPVFQEIAASSDLDKQVKYKKVCAAIKTNLTQITSSQALEFIQAQFREGSEEYNQVADRIASLDEEDEIFDEGDLDKQKIQGLTHLYLEASEKVRELERLVAAQQVELKEQQIECSRKIASLKRIVSSQLATMEEKLSISATEAARSTSSYKRVLACRTDLEAQVEELKEQNLKYVHKIEAASTTISQKDSTISKLEGQLSETVTASTSLKSRASNLDDKVENLNVRVEAAEQMVMEYQQAYANMYANALGVHLENLPVTASTSVEELQNMICSGASSCTSYQDTSSDIEELLDPEYLDDDMITL